MRILNLPLNFIHNITMLFYFLKILFLFFNKKKGWLKVISTKRKICVLGETGVGKSSLVSLLQGRTVSKERIPTIGLDIENSHLGGNKIMLWDIGGQERFRHMWKDFLRGSGLTVVVLDSTEENVSKTKEIVERFSHYIGSKVIAIANKQDLPDTLSAHDVQKKLGIRTYGMSAIIPELRERLKNILEYEVLSE